jgi:hypothetical protein
LFEAAVTSGSVAPESACDPDLNARVEDPHVDVQLSVKVLLGARREVRSKHYALIRV